MAVKKNTPETAAEPLSAAAPTHEIPLVSAMGIAEANAAAGFPVPPHLQDIIDAATPAERQAVIDARPKPEPEAPTETKDA